MRRLHVVLTNEDRGYRFSEWHEDLTETGLEGATEGEIYRAMQREFGRCTGRIYHETSGQPDAPCGWFFISRQTYEDTEEPYLRGAWVMLETVTIEPERTAT